MWVSLRRSLLFPYSPPKICRTLPIPRALKDLNKEKEEASLSRIIQTGISPELIELPPRGKGQYKLQWEGKDKEFMLVGTVSDHDIMVKKDSSVWLM
jgi:hypothetical protein